MREIKFRAWHKSAKKIISADLICFDEGYVASNEMTQPMLFDHIELMQFTGLKDKNGKDIYEGDVLKDEESKVFEVCIGGYYSETSCAFGVHYLINGDASRAVREANPFGKEGELEVIGNIYQNPELLNEE